MTEQHLDTTAGSAGGTRQGAEMTEQHPDRTVPEIRGRVALVTGGARGLGREICTVLAEAGACVVAADVRRELAEETAATLRERGYEARAIDLDVTDAARVDAAVGEVERDMGRVSILVNNAGYDVTKSVEEVGVDEWLRVIEVNLEGPFLLAKRVLPGMRAAGSGHIVNIASTAAKRAWANASAYHASKWGLLGLSHALHVEARPAGVKVTAVVCGGMRTPFLLDRFPDIDQDTLQDPRTVAETIRFILTQPAETVIPELMVLPMRETSWP